MPFDRRLIGRCAATLAVGAAGGAAAAALGLPAAWLVGASVAVTAAAAFGLPAEVPVPLRNLAFAVIGVSMGSGVSSETLEMAARWPVSLAALAACLALTMVLATLYLRMVHGCDRATALLGASPGALSYAIALSVTSGADTRRVALIQSIRLLALTAALPLLVDVASHTRSGAPVRLASDWQDLALLLGLAVLAGALFARLRAPAGYLLGGMAVSVPLHLTDIVAGAPPAWLVLPVFVVTGAVIGSRFRGVTRRDLAAGLAAGLGAVAVMSAVSALVAIPVAARLGLPFGQVWVAFAPGGVEAMAAMALALDFDPAYVAAHHVFRLLSLALLLPLLLRGAGAAGNA